LEAFFVGKIFNIGYKLYICIRFMWKIDLTYRDDFQTTFKRLFDKLLVLQKSRPLPQVALRKLKEALSIEWTYNSNSIEGNTLTLRETQLVLQEGITVKGKSLKEHFEAKNHETALNYLYEIVSKTYKINNKDILDLHQLVLRSIEDDFAGRLRTGGVRIIGANFVPPNALKVPQLLDELIEFVNTNPLQLNTIELATVFHHKFVWIHPFFDGNGRTVRLCMNLILMKAGFPPAIILANDRKKYYEALNSANNGNYSKLMLLMCQALERTLNIYLQSMPGTDSNYREISDLVEEEQLAYGQEYISLLARQGKIDAYKEGRNWLTTKEAVEDYIKARKRKKEI
jgi:Fic family protein